jgi:hypothetical protein
VGFDIENAEDDEDDEDDNTDNTLKQRTSSPEKKKTNVGKPTPTKQEQITLNDSELVNDVHIEAHLIPFVDDDDDEEEEEENVTESTEVSALDLERLSFEELNRKKLLNKNTSRVLTQFYKLEQESSKSFRAMSPSSAKSTTDTVLEQLHSETQDRVVSSGSHTSPAVHILPTIVSDDGSTISDGTPHSQQQSTPSTPLKDSPQTHVTPQPAVQSTLQCEAQTASQTPEAVKHMVPHTGGAPVDTNTDF